MGSEQLDVSSERVFAWSEYRRTADPGSPGTGRRRRRRPGVGAAVPLPGHARAGGAVAGGGAAVRVAPARAAGKQHRPPDRPGEAGAGFHGPASLTTRSEEHTSELKSLMRSSYAVFCLKKKTTR